MSQDNDDNFSYHLPSTSTSAIDSKLIRRALGPKVIANFSKTMAEADELDKLMPPILRLVHQNYPKADLEPIMHAYRFARAAHEGQFRKSGEPYLIHPIEVCRILAEMGLGVESLCAALLHDTIEDTSVTYNDVEVNFNKNIANLVEGVTKLSKIQYGENASAETIRKMIVAMSKDIRVLVIKLADRLHNARTWKFVPAESAARKAKETLDIYAPLAHRLGLNQVKRELEDLSFKTLHPKVYAEIEELVHQYAPERDEYVKKVMAATEKILNEAKIKATISGRPKHLFSIYQKMIIKGRDFKDIYDLVGIRIITDTILDCYAALGAVHAAWNHIPSRFKDYIAMPKYNMYQSIHTTVIGPERRRVEIQIRTQEMHHFAQFGIAAHWKYKENTVGGGSKGPINRKSGSVNQRDNKSDTTDIIDQNSEENLQWLKQLNDWQEETKDSREFLDSLRFDLGQDQVYVFTPKGEVLSLPAGSTPVDFAYTIHTEVGHRTMGAKVNDRLVPLNTELKNSDRVEILTSKNEGSGPSQDWLNFVKSPKARNKIRAWFSKSRKEEDIERGRDELAKILRTQNLPTNRLFSHEVLSEVAEDLKYQNVDMLYAAIGTGGISAKSVLRKLIDSTREDIQGEIVDEKPAVKKAIDDPRPTTPSTNPGISVSGVEGENDVWIKLAKCCLPVPGDLIIGFVTQGSGISIHRQDCFNIAELKKEMDPSRFIEANWIKDAVTSFMVQIQIEGLDRANLLADVTRVLSENHVSIISGSVETTKDRVALSKWTFEMSDPKHLAVILSSIRKIDGVFDVYRLTGRSV